MKKNILKIFKKKNKKIIEQDCFKLFDSNSNFQEKFDIIFLDPPYKEERINLIINMIKEKKILKENGILIIHRHKKDKLNITNKLRVLDERSYGISKIIIGN